jgi:putative ABC transport system permease protein
MPVRRLAALLLTVALPAAVEAVPPAAEPGAVPQVLVSRQLLEKEHLEIGEVISLSGAASGRNKRLFRIVGTYEPVADPARLGDPSLAVRLHLPDLIDLGSDALDPQAHERAGAINVKLAGRANPGDDNVGDADAGGRDVKAFGRELATRMPGLEVHSTVPREREADPFVVLERFHLAIAVVTVFASSMFLLALMVMLVDERRQTVAILRMIGLRRRRILLQVLAEGLLVALAGAGFGVLLAAVLQGGFNHFFQWRYDTSLVFVRVTPQIAARSVLLAVPLGVAASAMSSWSLLRRDALNLARR